MTYSFCPYCGTKYQSNLGHAFKCDSCGGRVFLNSKPTASVLIVEGNRILLGKRSIDPSKGLWDIIGGFLEYGEHPHDGAIREAKEESGLDVKITGYLGTFMDTYGKDNEATMNMCFVSEIVGGTPKPNDDIAELKWFSKDDLPKDLAFDNGKRMLEAWKAS